MHTLTHAHSPAFSLPPSLPHSLTRQQKYSHSRAHAGLGDLHIRSRLVYLVLSGVAPAAPEVAALNRMSQPSVRE